MAVNIRGVFLGMKYVLPRMRDGGSVVNMSSALGLVGGAGIVAYVASKHAIIGMTKTAALEQGPRGIRVNAAAPGPIAGRMTFRLADEVFAGSERPSPRRFRSGVTARRRTSQASSPTSCRMTPATRPARPTRSMAVSRPPERGKTLLQDGQPSVPPIPLEDRSRPKAGDAKLPLLEESTMTQRLIYTEIAPAGVKALGGVYGYVTQSGLPGLLVDLVYLRVSQINGCAYCIDMHSRDLLKAGLAVEKLVLVPAWREAGGLFDARERAALAWAETVTRVADTNVPDTEFHAASAIFSEKELADLTIAIGLMNTYNRLAIAFRVPPAAAKSA
jgi:AhpD family alkylhydroperoxidase